MDLGLKGRVAIVCASSQGLGKATATGFAREGAHVVICSRDTSKLDAAAQEIRREASSGTVFPVVADVSSAGQITNLVTETVAKFGRIDVLVTNAGGPPVGLFASLTDEQWEKGFSLNLMSTVRLIRAVVPEMQKRKWGRIINITSLTVKQPLGDLIISSSIRPGIMGLSKILSQQLGKDGILINTVAPGYFLTARQKEIGVARAGARGISVEAYLAEQAKDIPVGRLGDPEELANAIVFLASEKASYISGTVMAIDGGTIRGIF